MIKYIIEIAKKTKQQVIDGENKKEIRQKKSLSI